MNCNAGDEPGIDESRQLSDTSQFGLTPLSAIVRSVLEGIRATAEAEIECTSGFRGLPSATQYASNTINLAHREIDRLTLWQEEAAEIKQARAQRGGQ